MLTASSIWKGDPFWDFLVEPKNRAGGVVHSHSEPQNSKSKI